MAEVDRLADFVEQISFDDIADEAVEALKIRVLDSLGCALGALDGEPIAMLRAHLDDFGGNRKATTIGGDKTAPDRAALFNGALVRYLDFNDSFLAPGETCHPSDNLSAVLAAGEYGGVSGKELLTALAVAYQVHCRLSQEAPVRHKGFDHTTQGAYAAAAGAAKALGLDRPRIANAIAISGTAYNALRVTRTGRLSHWKGLAYPNTASGAVEAAFLAMRGITGPAEVFEGNKGFMDAIAGRFDIDWENEGLDAVHGTIIKKYNAEIHSQSAIEGLLDLKRTHAFDAEDVESIELETFKVAYDIIGGGEEGEKHQVRTKEEADHSLPYMLAVALLDGEVMPKQYRPERILKSDVQSLMQRVEVKENPEFSARFPAEMPALVTVRMSNGGIHQVEKRDYEGFSTRRMSWESVVSKFEHLAKPFADERLRSAIIDRVSSLEDISVADLTSLLAKAAARLEAERR